MRGKRLDPEPILDLALGFWRSKVVLVAVELQVFTILTEGPLDSVPLAKRAGIDGRGARDFFDALVALKLLDRTGGRYSNTPLAELYLDRNRPTYIGGFMELANARLYSMWERLTTGLRSGKPQSEAREGGELYDLLYADETATVAFLRSMTGLGVPVGEALSRKFPWEGRRSVADIGCAEGAVAVQILLRHAHLRGIGADLPAVEPLFERYVQAFGIQDRLGFHAFDLFVDEWPDTDVFILGNVLHNWSEEQRQEILAMAYDALPASGSLIVCEWIIDDERRRNDLALLMSLHMMLETSKGANFTQEACRAWMSEAGFKEVRVEPLQGATSMIIGTR